MANQQQSINLQSISASTSSINSITQDDLSNWEFIDQSDCSYDVINDAAIFDVQSFDSLSSDEEEEEEVQEQEIDSPIEKSIDVLEVNRTRSDEFTLDLTNCAVNQQVDQVNYPVYPVNYQVNQDYNESEYDDGYGDDYSVGNRDYYDDVDDYLVPVEVKGLFMRERIKKSEKKSMSKMIKSKKPLKCFHGRYAAAIKAY